MTQSIPDMPGRTLDYKALFERLQAGHSLITGNSRLSRVLAGQYGQWRIARGDRQWQSPVIVSWNLWLDGLWQSASLMHAEGIDRAVPAARQLLNLWEGTLKNEPLAHNLLRPESLASQLRDTRKLMTDWRLDFKDPAWFTHDNENHTAFYQWNKAFEKRCRTAGWVPPEDRLRLLIKAIETDGLPLPGPVDLLGFDEFNPNQAELLRTLIEHGNSVCRLTIASARQAAVLKKYKDSRDEMLQMALWVRYWFENEPHSSIAIVVPDLQSRRQQLERQLQEVLLPGRSGDTQQAKPWNISMGVPLTTVPMIEAAFDWLKLLAERVDIQDVGRVLRSPWFGGAMAERNSRALLEKCLRDKYPRQLKPGEVQYRASEIKKHDRYGHALPIEQHEPQPWHSPQLSVALNTLMKFYREHSSKRIPSAWAEAIDQLLSALGWPLAGETDTDTVLHEQNWQTLQAWRDCLRELASLDATSPRLDRQAAIGQLKQICRQKIFQLRTPDARIQVLGLYEISGLRFDHLWVIGLHNDTWPAAARPNPFIPHKLQRAVQLPNSSPQRELEVARTITNRLLETAPDCVFSYPGQIDGEDVLVSPLLSTCVKQSTCALPAWQGEDWRSTVAKADRPRLDSLHMPAKLVHSTARGGSSILRHQALCPFRAFASNRLAAVGLDTPADGINAMLHGSLIHSVLEYFWTETRTHSGLMQLDREQLHARLSKCVNDVIDKEHSLHQRPAFRGVEANRLYRQSLAYLELEKTREPFEVVGFEKEILPQIEGQSIRLVIDRVDRLQSGEEVIIDYKTGKVEPKKWFGPRPEDPQLPLYAISAEQTPAAVVFGIIRDDGCLYKGVVKQDGLLPGLPKPGKAYQFLLDAGHEMQVTIDNWRQTLHRLMSDFLTGEAAIDPKIGLKTCENSYCELQSLCRVGEMVRRQKSGQQSSKPSDAS